MKSSFSAGGNAKYQEAQSTGPGRQLLHYLHRKTDFFKPEERAALIKKYVPVSLNSLYRLYTAGGDDEDEGGDEDNWGKLQEMKHPNLQRMF